jgi:hypothetical protein
MADCTGQRPAPLACPWRGTLGLNWPFAFRAGPGEIRMSLAWLGTQQNQGVRMAHASPQGTVPSVTAWGAVCFKKPVNDVGESKFAAIVDRLNRMAGSGDYR